MRKNSPGSPLSPYSYFRATMKKDEVAKTADTATEATAPDQKPPVEVL